MKKFKIITNTVITNWGQNTWSSKMTLDDGSVVMEDGTTLNPSNYMLYLGQLMINKNSSDIYFTYWEEPALRIYGEIYRVTTAPKLQDSTLEAMASRKMRCSMIVNWVVILVILFMDVVLGLIFLVKDDIKWLWLGYLKRKCQLLIVYDCHKF